MNQDEYGEVINGERTYKDIAFHILNERSALIGWTDENGTHFDILFTALNVSVPRDNTIQGGVRSNDLFVSIMRKGAFGFEMAVTNTHPNYYAEKLCVSGEETCTKLAELINGVKKAILKI